MRDWVPSMLRLAPLWVSVTVLALGAGGCASKRMAYPPPVEDRGSSVGRLPPPPPPPPASASRPAARPDPSTLPGYENMGKPGYYTVKPGDNLGSIAKSQLGSTKRWQDLLAANSKVLRDPKQLKPGMTLVIPE